MDYSNLCLGCFSDKGIQNPCLCCGYEEKTLEASLYLPPRTILTEKYITGKVLGQGGFGITYLGWDMNLNMKLAIKEFFPQGLVTRLHGQSKVVSFTDAENQDFDYWLERFLNEARTLAQFEQHPNIVSVRDFFKANNTAYMIMSYVEGLTLDHYLTQSGYTLPCGKAIEVMMPVMDALREVHEAGVMHRDISPDNIFIDSKGRVVLIDFGAARQEISDKSKSLSVILKSGYAPEEQYRSKGKQGPWTDIYAVGATLYRCITGETPPEAIDRLVEDNLVPPSQLGFAIEAAQEAALLKALTVKAGERYQTVEEFQKELVAASDKGLAGERYIGIGPKEPAEPIRSGIKGGEEGLKEKALAGIQAGAVKESEKKPEPAEKAAGQVTQEAPAYTISKRTVKTAALVLFCGLFILGALNLFSSGDDVANLALFEAEETEQDAVELHDENVDRDEAAPENGMEKVIIHAGVEETNNTDSIVENATTKNLVETAQNNVPTPRKFEEPTNSISSINASITNFNLFEADYGRFRDEEYHIFDTRFVANETRFIYWRMNLKHPKPGVKKTFNTTTYIFKSDGSLFRSYYSNPHTIEPNWTSSWWSICTGWHEPGNWPVDKYRLEVIVDEVLVYVSAFELY